MNTTYAWVGAVVVAVALVIGFTSTETGPTTYKVGVILPLTGDSAKYGEPAERVMRIALEEVNAAGGVSGKPMELIFEDGKCNGKDAVSAMQKLTDVDKVEVVIGGFCSGESNAVVPVGEKVKVAMLSPGSTSPKLTGVSSYFSRNYPSAATQGAVLARIAYEDKGWRHVAFIQEQTDYAVGVHAAFSETFTKLGGHITKEEFPTETTDFRTIVTKLKDVGPDALFVDVQNAAGAERIFTQLDAVAWYPKLMVSNIVIADSKIIETRGARLEGVVAAEFNADASNLKFAALMAKYLAQYGLELPYQSYAQAEYDAVYLVRDALTAVGNDGTRIAKWLHSVHDWQGASGSVTIGTNGDPDFTFSPVTVSGGKKVSYAR